jgi:hypothetical protein
MTEAIIQVIDGSVWAQVWIHGQKPEDVKVFVLTEREVERLKEEERQRIIQLIIKG